MSVAGKNLSLGSLTGLSCPQYASLRSSLKRFPLHFSDKSARWADSDFLAAPFIQLDIAVAAPTRKLARLLQFQNWDNDDVV